MIDGVRCVEENMLFLRPSKPQEAVVKSTRKSISNKA